MSRRKKVHEAAALPPEVCQIWRGKLYSTYVTVGLSPRPNCPAQGLISRSYVLARVGRDNGAGAECACKMEAISLGTSVSLAATGKKQTSPEKHAMRGEERRVRGKGNGARDQTEFSALSRRREDKGEGTNAPVISADLTNVLFWSMARISSK